IPFTLPHSGTVEFKVMSINGQVLHVETVSAVMGYNTIDFTTESLSNGIYYYSMEYKGQRIVKKMTIQK
ncbi:MAG: T9SS type A sorting domain-containing protein, partial [Bacteroidales bacterium]|nr:T9SS type A sorting domain-containing protein [Bacteroidales bacterium]